MNTEPLEQGCYELRFQSRLDAERAYAFPCDAAGHVDMDKLSDKALSNYLYARTAIGAAFLRPSVHAGAGGMRTGVVS